MEEGTFYGLTMKTPVIYAEIQVLLMSHQQLPSKYQEAQFSLLETYKEDLQSL